MSNVKPIPEGFHSLNPYLVVGDADKAIDFYVKAFNGKELFRMPGPDGKIMHAEVRIGDSILMLGSECSERGSAQPQAKQPISSTIMLYVENADQTWDAAVKAGATVRMPLNDMFWGDRYGQIQDPFGHTWAIAQHIENVSPEEMAKRQEKFCKEMAGAKK